MDALIYLIIISPAGLLLAGILEKLLENIDL